MTTKSSFVLYSLVRYTRVSRRFHMGWWASGFLRDLSLSRGCND